MWGEDDSVQRFRLLEQTKLIKLKRVFEREKH
jgi:hypothetical protein